MDLSTIPSPFYRVAAKAAVLDDQGRVLVVQNKEGFYEMPGGGWEHDESYTECLRREFQEEIGLELQTVGQLLCVYTGKSRRGFIHMRILSAATIAVPSDGLYFALGDDMQDARFVTKQQFMQLPFAGDEAGVLQYADKIWPRIEKTA